MLRQIYAMTVKELKVLFRDRGAIVTLFLLPIVFIFVMTSAGTGGVTTSDEPAEILIVNRDEGGLAAEVVAELEALEGIRPVTEVAGATVSRDEAEELIKENAYNVAVVFPAGFTDHVLQAATDPDAAPATVTFVNDPALDSRFLAPIQGTVVGFIQRTAAYAQAPPQLEAAFAEMAAQAPPEQAPVVAQIGTTFAEQVANGDGLGSDNQGVAFDQVAPAGYVQTYPTAEEQNVPAYTIFGVFFIMQVVATGLLSEKQDGTLRRLMAAPMPRAIILGGKLLPYYLINLIQVALMFAIGVFVFGMGLGNSPLGLVLVSLATAAAATGLGLMLAAVGKTKERVDGLAVLLSILLAAIGGMFIPTFAMPDVMQQLSRVAPHSWALSGYQDVIVRGLGTGAVLNEVGVLLGFAAVFFAVAVWRFRFEG